LNLEGKITYLDFNFYTAYRPLKPHNVQSNSLHFKKCPLFTSDRP